MINTVKITELKVHSEQVHFQGKTIAIRTINKKEGTPLGNLSTT